MYRTSVPYERGADVSSWHPAAASSRTQQPAHGSRRAALLPPNTGLRPGAWRQPPEFFSWDATNFSKIHFLAFWENFVDEMQSFPQKSPVWHFGKLLILKRNHFQKINFQINSESNSDCNQNLAHSGRCQFPWNSKRDISHKVWSNDIIQ